jgi:MFS family permease
MGILALGWRQVYLFWFIPFLLGMIAVLGIKSEPTEDVRVDHVEAKRNPQATSLRSVSLVMFLLFLGIQTIAKSTTESFMALYMVENRGVSQSLAGLLIGSNTLVGVLAAPVGGFLAVRYGEKRWLLIVLTLAYACFGLAIATPNDTVFVILYLAYGFSMLLGTAANSAIMASLSPGKQRGLAFALFFLPSSIMGAVAPIVAGSLAETYSLVTIFYASAAVFFISLGTLQFGVKLRDSA